MMIGLWCGSLGAHSANSALLRVAAARITERGHEALSVVDVATIPVFDPALVDDPPEAVAELRRQLRTCDAVTVAAPEYAAGVAGSMKNALDWLVGDATIYRKVVGVASGGTTGGIYAVELRAGSPTPSRRSTTRRCGTEAERCTAATEWQSNTLPKSTKEPYEMSQKVTVAFIGHAKPEMTDRAAAFEDEALALLIELGGAVVFRGRRVANSDESLPAEVHILSFPSREVFISYLDHGRRRQLLEQHGDTFETKVVVEVDPVEGTATHEALPGPSSA